MTTLSKRATLSQKRILRAVEGAAKNAGHAHPEWMITDRIARSIAKRAAGTLTAQWPDVLAARSVPSSRSDQNLSMVASRSADRTLRLGRGPSLSAKRRPPLLLLWKQVAAMCGEAKRMNKPDRIDALIDVLKLIAKSQIH